jgi:hypothetical protein
LLPAAQARTGETTGHDITAEKSLRNALLFMAGLARPPTPPAQMSSGPWLRCAVVNCAMAFGSTHPRGRSSRHRGEGRGEGRIRRQRARDVRKPDRWAARGGSR